MRDGFLYATYLRVLIKLTSDALHLHENRSVSPIDTERKNDETV